MCACVSVFGACTWRHGDGPINPPPQAACWPPAGCWPAPPTSGSPLSLPPPHCPIYNQFPGLLCLVGRGVSAQGEQRSGGGSWSTAWDGGSVGCGAHAWTLSARGSRGWGHDGCGWARPAGPHRAVSSSLPLGPGRLLAWHSSTLQPSIWPTDGHLGCPGWASVGRRDSVTFSVAASGSLWPPTAGLEAGVNRGPSEPHSRCSAHRAVGLERPPLIWPGVGSVNLGGHRLQAWCVEVGALSVCLPDGQQQRLLQPARPCAVAAAPSRSPQTSSLKTPASSPGPSPLRSSLTSLQAWQPSTPLQILVKPGHQTHIPAEDPSCPQPPCLPCHPLL